MPHATPVRTGREAMQEIPTVVIVDDEPLVVRALERLLRRSFHVISATTPQEALEAVDHHDVAVVLSDQRMPAMGGAELLTLIRRHDPRVMGLLITAYADIDAAAAAINDASVMGYLRKPWRDQDVLDAVQRAVEANEEVRSGARDRVDLRRHQEIVRVLVDHAPIGVAVLGPAPDLVFARHNAPFFQLMAGVASPVVGSTVAELLSPEASETIRILCLRAARSGEPVTSPEFLWAVGDSTARYVSCTVSPLGATSDAESFVLTATDITAVVEAREDARHLAARLTATLEQMPSGVVVVDAAGRTVMRNDMARRLQPSLTDLSPSSGVDARPRDPKSGRVLRPHELPLARALAGEHAVSLDYRQHQSGGALDSWIRASAVPLIGPDGVITGALAVCTDVSTEYLAEQARNVSLASAGHELRTPLTSLLGFTRLLLADELGALSKSQRNAIDRIKCSGERLHLLVEDIMDITTIESGHSDLRPSRVDIGAVLGGVVESFAPQVRAKQQQLSLELPREALFAWADPRRVEQIVANLVSNAHKYTLGGGQIMIRASHEAAGIVVTIEDTGVGLSEDEISSLFTKYYRARNLATWDVPGTGLGLAITRGLVERQGGSITIESTPGVGSIFGFRLPLDSST